MHQKADCNKVIVIFWVREIFYRKTNILDNEKDN